MRAAVFLDKAYGSARAGVPVDRPMPTITAGGGKGGGHIAAVCALLARFDRDGKRCTATDDRTTKALRGIVMIDGVDYQIVDIAMRMLSPRELYRAQSFGDHYIIDPIVTLWRHGKHVRDRMPKTHQIAKCGNANPPRMAEVLIRPNYSEREVAAA